MTVLSQWTHGVGAYRSSQYGCRCDRCRAGNTQRARSERADRAARLAADPTLAPHGQVSTYRNWRCRCGPCTAANISACADRRARRSA